MPRTVPPAPQHEEEEECPRRELGVPPFDTPRVRPRQLMKPCAPGGLLIFTVLYLSFFFALLALHRVGLLLLTLETLERKKKTAGLAQNGWAPARPSAVGTVGRCFILLCRRPAASGLWPCPYVLGVRHCGPHPCLLRR